MQKKIQDTIKYYGMIEFSNEFRLKQGKDCILTSGYGCRQEVLFLANKNTPQTPRSQHNSYGIKRLKKFLIDRVVAYGTKILFEFEPYTTPEGKTEFIITTKR